MRGVRRRHARSLPRWTKPLARRFNRPRTAFQTSAIVVFARCHGLVAALGVKVVEVLQHVLGPGGVLSERLTEQVREGRLSEFDLTAFFASTSEVKPDGQGRINVPSNVREEVGLEERVLVLGAGNRIEIWDPEAWNASRPERGAVQIPLT